MVGGRRAVAIVVIMGGLVAACGGESDETVDGVGSPTTVRPAATTGGSEPTISVELSGPTDDVQELNASPVAVTSDDGLVTLEVPPGAMPAGTEITITANGGGMETFGVEPQSAVYTLEPDGLRFAEPAMLDVRLPARPEWDGGVPLLTMVVASDGQLETSVQNQTRRDGEEIVVTGSLEHFSQFGVFGGTAVARLIPPFESASPGDRFEAGVNIAFTEARGGENGIEVGDRTLLYSDFLLAAEWGSSGELSLVADDGSEDGSDAGSEGIWSWQTYECGNGSGRYGVEFSVAYRGTESVTADALDQGLILAMAGIVASAVATDGASGILFGEADCTGLACELEESDPSRPSIGRTGSAAAEAAPEIVGGANTRLVGQAIAQEVDDEVLCLEHVVAMYEDGTVSPEMLESIERAVDWAFDQ
jgi:hypothetical protein